MSAALGRDMQVFVKEAGGAFTLLAGLQTKSLKFKSKPVDATNLSSLEDWRELLPGAGVKSADISGCGIFTNAASSALARSIFFDGQQRVYRFILPEFGQIEGAFLITELSYSGDYDEEAAYGLALQSAGALSFTPQT